MSTQIHVGKYRKVSMTVINEDVVDNTTPLTVSTGNVGTLGIMVNPANPREVFVIGISDSPGVNAIVSVFGKTASALIEVVHADAPPQPITSITFGAFSEEFDVSTLPPAA
jgi:hypothetical protein